MAHCIVCKKELSDSEIRLSNDSGLNGLYCYSHLLTDEEHKALIKAVDFRSAIDLLGFLNCKKRGE